LLIFETILEAAAAIRSSGNYNSITIHKMAALAPNQKQDTDMAK